MTLSLLNKSVPTDVKSLIEILHASRQLDGRGDLAPTFKDNLTTAVEAVKKSITAGLPIIIHGDYDVDGISATAILWETIYNGLNYQNCLPFIPNRFDHGYGLSNESVEECQKLATKLTSENRGLLIAVDCGITANDAVNHAKELGFDVLIIDHHQKPEILPEAEILWTDQLCSGGIVYFLSQQLAPNFQGIDLAALATIADLQPLTGQNRLLVKQGLVKLSKPARIGLIALKEAAGLAGKPIGVYEVGYMLAPRLNAAGRLEDGLVSLRLLCTKDKDLASKLSTELTKINTERQQKTLEMFEHAESFISEESLKEPLIIVDDPSYHEGIIGLIAGKLSQKYCRPSIAISRGQDYSKGSARSLGSFDVVTALRSQNDLLENVGGHPLAAGFTVKTSSLATFKTALQEYAKKVFVWEEACRITKVDCELPLAMVNHESFTAVQELSPFGIGNPEPVFLSKDLEVTGFRTMGAGDKHLGLSLLKDGRSIKAVVFGQGELAKKLNVGNKIDVAYSLSKNDWNGNSTIEMRIRDLNVV